MTLVLYTTSIQDTFYNGVLLFLLLLLWLFIPLDEACPKFMLLAVTENYLQLVTHQKPREISSLDPIFIILNM